MKFFRIWACGLLLLNEFNTFMYYCKICQCKFDTGPCLEVHILSEHQVDEKPNVNDDTFVDDYYEQETDNCVATEPMSFELDPINIKTEYEFEDDGQQEIIVGIEEPNCDLKPNTDIPNVKFTSDFSNEQQIRRSERKKRIKTKEIIE